jgi:hypothetical protein
MQLRLARVKSSLPTHGIVQTDYAPGQLIAAIGDRDLQIIPRGSIKWLHDSDFDRNHEDERTAPRVGPGAGLK